MLMLRNLVSSLIEHDQITTTVAKAKETARLAEKLITLSKRSQKQFNKALLVANGIESSQPTANQLELQKRQDRHHKMQANQFLLVRFGMTAFAMSTQRLFLELTWLPTEPGTNAPQALQRTEEALPEPTARIHPHPPLRTSQRRPRSHSRSRAR